MNHVGVENIRVESTNGGLTGIDTARDGESLHPNVLIGGSNGESLQDAFAKFREQKKIERRLMKACRTPGNRTEEFKDQLRSKFVAQAHLYLGIPYHEKYREEGTEIAPLYLDCCGLVRRCLQDLKEDFGFLIGRWNQAYQMDTLPNAISFEQLKPGDLIFYEGTFLSKRHKVQKHDNVHVEIFLGGDTGEATIGARFARGVIQVFPSYKFESKLWILKAHHFRSIETWLDGLCVSHCDEHPWISETGSLYAAAGRKSIFNDDDEGEEAAGDYSDDDVELGVDQVPDSALPLESAVLDSSIIESASISEHGDAPTTAISVQTCANPTQSSYSARVTSGSAKIPPRSRKSAEANTCNAPVVATGSSKPLQSKRAHTRAEERDKKEMLEGKPLPKTYYVHKSNGWKLVCAALDKRGWQQLPFEYNMSTRFTLKWVERRSQIDYQAHVPGQLVNHIINNDVFTTKLGLLNTLRDFFCRSPPVASSSAQSPAKGPLSGSKKQTGIKQSVPHSSSSGRISFDDMILTSTPRLPTPWLMETYQLDQAIDLAEVLKDDKEAAALDTPESQHLWIYKPSAGNRGRGVHVVRGGRELLELVAQYVRHYHPSLLSTTAFQDIADMKTPVNVSEEATGVITGGEEASPTLALDDDSACFGKIPRAIIQRYCINPLLVDGYKFDIRCYMLVARSDPGYLAFYHPGYCRFALMPYSYDHADAGDPFVHLTNASIQKKHPNYQERKEMQTLTPETVREMLIAGGDQDSADYIKDQMDMDMMHCMVDVLKAAKVKMLRKSGYFDLFGFDFMLVNKRRSSGLPPPPASRGKVTLRNDNTRRLLLLEANTNPALFVDSDAQASIIPHVVDGALELVLAANLPPDKNGECGGVKSRSQYLTDLPGRFRLIYDENSGFEFGKTEKPHAVSTTTADRTTVL